ncbi:MAG: hypothetical protein Q9221_004287 [Calogaya cf. arnoldii]
MSSNTSSPLGHSSIKAIAVTWALTSFLPLPLILCIFLIRYRPQVFNGLNFSSLLPRVQPGSKLSRFTWFSNLSASTPSSHTLAVSNTSSYTLPVLDFFSPSTPPPRFSIPRAHPSPRTPQKSSPDSSLNLAVPPTSKASPNINGSSKKPVIRSRSSNPFFPASESPKCLSFLEPPSLKSTPRKSYSRLPPNNLRPAPILPSFETSPTPVIRHQRRLRKRFVVSASLLFVIFALYVLDGFAIAAAQDYVQVRVLSHNGKGGLGKGKENEKRLVPWIMYIFVQGGLLFWAAWMVNSSRRKAKSSAHANGERTEDNNKRPQDNMAGDIEMQDFGNDEEKETFLPASQTGPEDVFRDDVNGRANETLDEEEEKEWTALGFSRTSDSPRERIRICPPKSRKPRFITALQQETHLVNPNGEGSSSGPSYDGSGYGCYLDDSGIPLPDLPEAVWQAERSLAEMKLQKRSSREEECSIPEDQDTLLQDKPTGTPRNVRNSWEQGDDTRRDSTPFGKTLKGKGKGKEKEVIEPATPIDTGKGKEKEKGKVEKQVPRTPKLDSLPTGIDLNNDYKFVDDQPYPIIPLPKRHRKSTSTLQPPRTPVNHSTNDEAYPFPTTPSFSSPTPSFSSSTSASPRFHHRPPVKPIPSRLQFTNPNNTPQTPTRTHIPNKNTLSPKTPQTPPLTARPGRFTFSPPSPSNINPSPYAASPTFTPFPPSRPFPPQQRSPQRPQQQQHHHLQASPSFSTSSGPNLLTPPLPSYLRTPQQQQPAHRIPTGHTRVPNRVLNTLSRSPLSPSTSLSSPSLLSTPSLTSSSPLRSSSPQPYSPSPLSYTTTPTTPTTSSPSASSAARGSPTSSSSRIGSGSGGRGKNITRKNLQSKGRGRKSYGRLGSLGTVREGEASPYPEDGEEVSPSRRFL